jgi:cytochrome P450
MDVSPASTDVDAGDWFVEHFDPMSPVLAGRLHDTLTHMRTTCPVAHSDQYGGFWFLTRYDDVMSVLQDTVTFTNTEGLTVPTGKAVVPNLPEEVDPPLHRMYRKVINPYLTPAAIERWQEPTRAVADRPIDNFIEVGRCDLMADFATPFPGLTLFEFVLNAPREHIPWLQEVATAAAVPTNPRHKEAWQEFFDWINEFIEDRRRNAPRGDVVDAIIAAEIDGRPITQDEIVGIMQQLVQGGLETTAGALGQFVLRFCVQPDIPALLRRQPDLIPDAVEELLRLDTPFLCIGRTATRDTVIDGHHITKGDKVIVSWASANRDESEFPSAATFDPGRPTKRHLTFGAGPHRCVGSNIARLNLRVAVEQIVHRLDHIRLQEDAGPISFHSAYNRAPLKVPIAFTPGPRASTG